MRVAFVALALMLGIDAHAQTFLPQIAHADDGKVWVEATQSSAQNFTVNFFDPNGYSLSCTGTLQAAPDEVDCDVPSGMTWAATTGSDLIYINFTGNRLYGVAQLQQLFPAQAYTGVAILNPTSSSVSVTVRLLDQYYQIVDDTTFSLSAYTIDARFAYEWFPNANWNSTLYLEIFENDYEHPAILKLACNPETWVCEQV